MTSTQTAPKARVRKPTPKQRLDAPTWDLAMPDSPFTHPAQVVGALTEAGREPVEYALPAGMRTTMEELETAGLVERYLTTRGAATAGKRWITRYRLTEDGRARRARASRAAALAANGLL